MKKLLTSMIICLGFIAGADAAVRSQSATTVNRGAAATNTSTRATATARAATTARSATQPRATTARAATTGRTTVSRTSAATSSTPTVAARAATTQKVLNAGTSVQAANENIVVSADCRQKYYGCMDSFCMLDNDSGGRCICSDRNAELDAILDKIQQLDQQSYQMATYGVERIEMGADADAAIANANAVAQSIIDSVPEEEPAKREFKLDLSLWDTSSLYSDNVFDETVMVDPIEGKEGDALYQASHAICAQQIPECAADMNMLQLMYAQQIRSDCSAYENSLKQQQNASAQKLAAAEQALRSAALEQYRSANKYDLGQCTVEFKNCMITTGGCGDDFAGCATVAAFDATNTRGRASDAEKYSIKGAVTEIEINASTYDILLSKKPLCESVTQQCVNVADQVWDTFLRDIAPQVKSAELIAEDNARQNCIGNISSCFQQACRDTMDPNDPDGSYDMCLTRPETMLNLCTVPLNACGISTTSAAEAEASQIWEFVVARLQSMRVNSCTTQVKECLQSEDRCGSDYTQCIGMDSYTIIRMCPQELLIGCQGYDGGTTRGVSSDSQDAFYSSLENMIQGIFLNIDNNMLAECQNAANEAMISVCGDTENCDSLAVDDSVGANTLEYKICQIKSGSGTDIDYNNCVTDLSQISDAALGRGGGKAANYAIVIDGEIDWGEISFDDEGRVVLGDVPDTTTTSDTTATANANASVATVANEPLTAATTLQPVIALNRTPVVTTAAPELVASEQELNAELVLLQNNINNAINTIESNAQVNFCMTGREVQGIRNVVDRTQEGGRFPSLTKQMRMLIASSAIKAAMDNYYERYEELTQRKMQDYVTMNERIAEINNQNTLDARREAARIACVELAESDGASGDDTENSTQQSTTVASLNGQPGGPLAGARETANDWNYKETITSTFDWETLACTRCTRKQNCLDPKGGRRFCKEWEDPVETCTTVEF